MNKYGFYIKSLQLEGKSVENVKVTFTKGLNVVYGPSDVGKTYIFQCINYMLGNSKIPKKIPEAKPYDICKLEIGTYQNETFLLKRSLKGGDFEIIDKEILKYENKENSKQKTISDFLLKICNIENKKIRTNKKGKLKYIYFQNLRNFFLVDENRIIKEKSIIRTDAYTSNTEFENIFKFLVTSQDDSGILTLLTKDEVTNKKGKLELLKNLISELQKELDNNINYNEVKKQIEVKQEIEKLDEKILNFQKDYSLSNNELKRYDKKKNELLKEIDEKKKRLINIKEILIRSNILKKQYKSDISRLNASLGMKKNLFERKIKRCPICFNENIEAETINIQQFSNSINKEIQKIKLLQNELIKSRLLFNKEEEELVIDMNKNQIEYDNLLLKIEKDFNEKLKNISIKIKEYLNKKSKLLKIKILNERLIKLIKQKDDIDKIIKKNKEEGKNNNYEELSLSILDPITNIILEILKDIKFENISKVSFSEDNLDFVIDGKERSAFGKGYRAILYASFIISVLECLRTKNYQIGFSMIDSPLNPYKPGEERDGEITTDLGKNFYKYLSSNIINEQVILIENTEVPKEIIKNINYIKYTKENAFLPNLKNVEK